MILAELQSFPNKETCADIAWRNNTLHTEAHREIFDIFFSALPCHELVGEVVDILNSHENKTLLFLPISYIEKEGGVVYRFSVVDRTLISEGIFFHLNDTRDRYNLIKHQLLKLGVLRGHGVFEFELPQSDEDLATLCNMTLSLPKVYDKLVKQ